MVKMLLKKCKTLKPDVVTMDIEMPIMNGLEALKEIMTNTQSSRHAFEYNKNWCGKYDARYGIWCS